MNCNKWAVLKGEDIETLGLATYTGEVILIDYKADKITGESFHFNAQEYFTNEELRSMPVFDVWLFVDKTELEKAQ